MKTKYGTASPNGAGHLRITSRKEGNHGKLLHRIIWEEFYGKPVPKNCEIHHLNEDKQDNRIQNLQCCEQSKHRAMHMKKRVPTHKGKFFSKEHKLNLSKSMNTSGYYRVYKMNDKNCKQGFRWRYFYYENGKKKSISSVSLEKLEEKVKAKGLEWHNFEEVGVIYD